MILHNIPDARIDFEAHKSNGDTYKRAFVRPNPIAI
jgi:hypothetical protein